MADPAGAGPAVSSDAGSPTGSDDETGGDVAGERRRIEALDVLRGFALCGILLVNIGPVTGMGYDAVEAGRISGPAAPELWLHMLVDGRFFPIFSFLFGIGFAIFLDSAAGRHPRPRLLLLRRLAALGLLGALHQTLHPGEALLPYAVFGLLVLVPASFLPPWAVLAGGAAGAVAGVTAVHGGMLLIPGMFLLGMAAARYRVPQRLDRLTGRVGIAFALFAAAADTTGLSLIMRTPPAGALHRLFAPLGRMALTNYITATPVVLAAGWALDFSAQDRWGALFALAAAVLAAQWVFSVLWLRAFRYGPLEWAWRCVTWWRPVPLRREARPAAPAAA